MKNAHQLEFPILTLPDEDEAYLKPSLEGVYEQGEINLAEARLYSGQRAVAPEVTMSEKGGPKKTRLELVDEDYVPEPIAKREAILRKPRKAKTWREKMAADQPPEHVRVPALGDNPHLTVRNGGQADRC